MTVKDIYDFLNSIAPFDTAEEWDNCGLLVGDFEKNVEKIYIALDVTNAVIEDAASFGADLVITHHPLIFDPVSRIIAGSTLYKAVESGMSFIASHTCLDKAAGGVNDCLAQKVGVKNLKSCGDDPFLKLGEISPCSVAEFAAKVKTELGGTVSFTDSGKPVGTVALCSGAGGDLVSLAAQLGADAFLTGEAKHHEFALSNELGISLLVAGHYETENIICESLEKALSKEFGSELRVKASGLANPVNHI